MPSGFKYLGLMDSGREKKTQTNVGARIKGIITKHENPTM